MPTAFEELDYCHTVLGELVLRRRRSLTLTDIWVYEVKLAGRFLMSSLNTDSEQQLATRALLLAQGSNLRVLVGGLGLGYTAAAALSDPRVVQVDVIELLPPVIGWHRRGLLPLGDALSRDPRCNLIEGDCLQELLSGNGPNYDLILVDIDDSPVHLLDESHAAFYTTAGLTGVRSRLLPHGIFALWTSLPAEPEVTERLRLVFPKVTAEEVSFDNPLLDANEVNAIYFGGI